VKHTDSIQLYRGRYKKSLCTIIWPYLRRWYDRKSEYINKKGKIMMVLYRREEFNILNPHRDKSDSKERRVS